ncbi:MAG: hypothetical protein J6A01_07005 [Proteobacteria bacterium]|nr:hypothetical protein [Pseudomonadota bacterium]
MKKIYIFVSLLLLLGCNEDNNNNNLDTCNPACNSNQRCVNGLCLANAPVNECNPACTSEQTCVDGTCQPNTSVNECNPACTSDQTCVNGICQPNTPVNECNPACTSEQTCVNGTCQPNTPVNECNPACTSEQTCVDGTCQPNAPVNECNPACTSDQTCVDGTCQSNAPVNECNPACKQDQMCVDGTCKPKPSCKTVVDTGLQAPMPDAESTDEQCSNGENDFHTQNKDGSESSWFDCKNFQCAQNPLVQVCGFIENDDQACSDGIDNPNGSGTHNNFKNKSNGLVDCKDPSCFKNPNVTVCKDEAPKYEFGDQCADGKDNDEDGLADCEDPDCLHAGASCCDLGTKVRILFDNAHHEVAGAVDWIIDVTGRHPFPSMPAAGNEWHGSLSDFGLDLLKSGKYIVETLPQNRTLSYGSKDEVQDLSNYKILVLPEPSSSFSDTEVKAIHGFVMAGGGVLLVADHEGADRDGNGVDAYKAINDLLARLPGAQNEKDNPFGFYVLPGSFEKNTKSHVAAGSENHAVIKGPHGTVVQTGMYGAAGFEIINTAKVKVLLTEQSSSEAFAIAAEVGKGRIVAIGDSAIMGDGTNFLGLTLNSENGYIDTTLQNRELFLNAIDWLNH